MGDARSYKFATNLVRAFRAAGWNLPGEGFIQAIYPKPIEGIIIQVRSKDEIPAALQEFSSLLHESGIKPIGEIKDDLPNNTFRIIVGSMP